MANRKLSQALTDRLITTAKPKEKDYVLSDGKGLQMLVRTNGSKLWECRYTVNGKTTKTSIGNYPSLSLADARKKRDEYWSLAKQGISPTQAKRKAKQSELLEAKGQFALVVQEWISTLGCSDNHKKIKLRNFERDIFPYRSKQSTLPLGAKHIKEITHSELLEAIEAKQQTAIESGARLFRDCKNVWLYAIAKDYTDNFIFAKIVENVSIKKSKAKHYPKITDESTLRELLQKIDAYHGETITRLLLKFVTIIPLRAENLCTLRWEQVDFEKAIITIPRHEMKVKDTNIPDFKVPLPHQAVSILQEAKKITGWGVWVFHGLKDFNSHINLESANKALRIMGFTDEVSGRKQTLHSFRGTFRSLVDTHQAAHNATFETKERVLDHHEKSQVVRAYQHGADYTEQMRPLMQWWADFLDGLKSGG